MTLKSLFISDSYHKFPFQTIVYWLKSVVYKLRFTENKDAIIEWLDSLLTNMQLKSNVHAEANNRTRMDQV